MYIDKEYNQTRQIGVKPSHGANAIPVGKIPDNATQVAEQEAAENSTAVIHTVTTGKTLYLSLISYDALNWSGGRLAGSLYVTNASDTIQYYFSYAQLNDGSNTSNSLPFLPPLEIPTGYKIKVESSGDNLYISAFIHGYEA